MGTTRHWNWTAAEPLALSAEIATIGFGPTRGGRGTTGAPSLFYITKDNELFNAQQRAMGDSTTWEVQPEFSSTPPETLHGNVKARQFMPGGTVDLFVVETNFSVSRFQQKDGFGSAWVRITDTGAIPFGGQPMQQLAAIEQNGLIQLVGLTKSGEVLHQRQLGPSSLQWGAWQSVSGLKAYLVEIAANANNSGLLEIFAIDDHKMIRRVRQTDIANDVWGGSELLLAGTQPTVTGFVIGQNADKRLELFGTDTKSNLFHAYPIDTSAMAQWSEAIRFEGSSPITQVTVVPNQDGRLEIFYVGTNGSLFHNWQVVPSGIWAGETVIPGCSGKAVTVAMNVGGLLELFWIDEKNALQHSWQTVTNAGWINTSSAGGNVPSPPLGGNANLILRSGNCNLLTDVAVTIFITEDLTFSGDGDGFTWQLNCLGRKDDLAFLQQYTIGFERSHHGVIAEVNSWTFDPGNSNPADLGLAQLIRTGQPLKSLSGKTIPAGSQLAITLGNDGFGNITSATFVVVDEKGDTVGRKTIEPNANILSPFDKKSSIVGPITCATLNLVGPYDGEAVTLTSGAGTIIYVASSILTANAKTPSCTGFSQEMLTAETSNSAYGPISADASNLLQQTFSITPGGHPLSARTGTRLLPPTPRY